MTAGARSAIETPQGRLKITLVLAAAALQVFLGMAVALTSERLVLAGLAAALGLALVLWRPAAVGLTLVLLASTIFTLEYIPRVSLPGGQGLYATELIVAGYVVCRGLRLLMLKDRSYQPGPLEIILVVFLFQVLFASYLAVAAGRIEFAVVHAYARPYLLYAAFFVFAGTLRDERSWRRFLDIVQLIAAVTAVLTIAQAVVGFERRLFFGNPLEYIMGQAGLYPRVRPPAFYLTAALFVPAFALLVSAGGARRRLQAVYLALYSAAILISLQRIVWLAIIVGLLAYLLLVSGRLRASTLRGAAVMLVVGVLVTVGLARLVPQFGETAVQRLLTLGTGEDVNTLDKLDEYRLAFRQIARAPVFGSGPGVDFGAVAGIVVGDHYEFGPRSYTHNSYVNLLLYFGLLGLGMYLALVLLALRAGVQALRQEQDTGRRALLAGLIAAVIVVLVIGLAMTVLGFHPMVVPLSLMLAGLQMFRRSAGGDQHACIAG